MELSDPNIQISGFTLLNASDSQTQNSYSLSIPSEPPELGNWFPSYKYESPVLDSDDDFRDSVSEEKMIQKDQIFTDDSERGKEDSLRRLEEIGKRDEVLVGDDNIKNQSLNETTDFNCSPSFHSEPIDLKYWFSSYVYESPALDTSDGFNDFLYKESECEKDGLIVEESRREKVVSYVKFKGTRTRDGNDSSNRLINCGNYSGDNRQEKQLLNKGDPRSTEGKHICSDKSCICLQSTLKQCSKYKALQNCGIDPAKEVELSSLDQEDPRCALKFSEVGIMSLQERTCRSDTKLSENSICRIENVEDSEAKGHKEAASCLSPESDLKSVLVNESVRKSNHGCKDKENARKEIPTDGFVTARKGRFGKANAENLQEIPKENGKWKVFQPGGRESVIERKVLSERTNFHLSSAAEITGKWQCPQKRKPNLGPPMKQLRLERWIQKA